TQLRILQKQLFQAQKMEAIGTMAGGIAHDFNNILQVALGYSEFILIDKELPERYRPDLTKIHESAKRGADLVRGLLTFSRKTEIELQPLNLNSRISELRKMIERTIPKMINIQILLAEDLAAINANPTQVDQILMNLMVNARDAMPDGGKLTIETANFTFDEEYTKTHFDVKRGRYVRLMVTDSGTGMDKDTLEHIFEPFYTTKGVGEGTGLGLSMVHGIMKQHGGHIMCYSEPGQGTTFKIYFPALISDEEEKEAGERKMPRGGSETILLVDDEEFIRELGYVLLTKAGYQVIKASNGKEALDVYQARGGEIALVILDLIMPEMGGKQCLEGLLGLDPSIKVLIASGYSADGPGKEALEAGAKGFVNKPYNNRQMLEVVRSILDEK
ncbi:MAG: response regulator, partial [Deltaproteobacteria bacterium]|nr:response regulator [Deltaproteobacteria bacterium]